MRRFWRQCFLIVYLFALPVTAQERESQDTRDIHIENAWVRAMPPGQSNTAAYLSIKNGGDRRVQITGASSEPQARVEPGDITDARPAAESAIDEQKTSGSDVQEPRKEFSVEASTSTEVTAPTAEKAPTVESKTKEADELAEVVPDEQ